MDPKTEMSKTGKEELYSTAEEYPTPITAELSGTLPAWLIGDLLRVGPAKFEWGDTKYNHWFDGDAMVHKFSIDGEKVHYCSQFVRSESYLLNQNNARISSASFATPIPPDPCQNIFSRFFSKFVTSQPIDNTNVNLFPIKERIFASTEIPKLNRIDVKQLDTVERVDFSKNMPGARGWLAHPHIEEDGTLYNLSTVWDKGIYEIIKIPSRKDELEDTFAGSEVISSISFNWRPSYYHSFGITDNYFVLFNNPFTVSFSGLLAMMQVMGWSFKDMFRWDPNGHTQILIVDRVTGKVIRRAKTEKTFVFHHVNAYEEGDSVVVDVIGYKDASIIDTLYLHALHQPSLDTENLENFQPSFRRYKVPLSTKNPLDSDTSSTQASDSFLPYTVLCESAELPTINYRRYNGKCYKYAYLVNELLKSDGYAGIIKLNVETKDIQGWTEEGCHASEPIFVEHPDAVEEDDGVLLSAVIGLHGKSSFLLVLDAKTLQEIARASVPLRFGTTLHGLFLKDAQ